MSAGSSLLLFAVLLVIGYLFGRHAESKHYQSILERERSLAGILLLQGKHPPPGAVGAELVMGNTVVSVDYFKFFVAGLRGLIGGPIHSYESLLDRARREALLRMKQSAADKQANAVTNVRIETSSISKSADDGRGTVEVLAYGTATRFDPNVN